jgi:hypothetical protein
VSGVADGTHSYTATATDGTGNGSPASTADHVIVDRVPPTTSITSGPSGVISQSSVSFGFASSEAGSSFQCELAGPGSQPGSFSPCASPATYANLADGAYTFAVQANDPAGNPDPNPPARSFTVQSATGGGSHGGPSPLATQAMTSLGLSPPTFRAASSGPSATRARTKAGARARTGSTITFTLRMAGRVRYTVEAPLSGRRVHGRCVAASKSNHRSPACTRYRALRGTFSLVGVAGVNRFHFTGRLAGKKLAPGRYRLVATPSGGAPVRAAFRIKR